MFENAFSWLSSADPVAWRGELRAISGLVVESAGPPAALGDFCEIQRRDRRRVRTQVVGFRGGATLLMPLEELGAIAPGDAVYSRPGQASVAVGAGLLGRVLDGFGEPMDGGPPLPGNERYALLHPPPGPLERLPVELPLETGIRALDGFLTCGLGQRIGIFGGSGVGKSTLLGSLARHHKADVTVLCLIGERNREVRDFLEHVLTPEARERAVLVVSTSDRPAPLRIRACFVALAIAEYFRDQGADVLLVADSVTRLAMAQREIGLAAGEPPSQRGYTPSVFDLLPKVLERAGRFSRGSITGFFTVLVEGDDMNEPIADAVRGILDGHIILSRQLGAAGHYPAIDVLQSISRLASRLAPPEQVEAARRLRLAMASFQGAEDLIRMGAYVNGADPRIDAAIQLQDPLRGFLRQSHTEICSLGRTQAQMAGLAAALGAFA